MDNLITCLQCQHYNVDTLSLQKTKKKKKERATSVAPPLGRLLLTYWILVFVCVDAGVHDSSEEVVHDAGQRLGVQHAVQRAHKHRLAGVQTLGGAAHIVAVRDHPGDHLHLEQGKVPDHTGHTSLARRGCKDGLKSNLKQIWQLIQGLLA